MNINEKQKKLFEILKEMNKYAYACNIMQFDALTVIPKKGYDINADVVSFFATKVFMMTKEPSYIELVEDLYNNLSKLKPLMQAKVKWLKKALDDEMAIPAEEVEEFSKLQSESYVAWKKAREENNFSLWAPYLEKIVETRRRFVSYRKEKYTTVYNALLDDYEKDMDEEKLDIFFNSLKEKIVPLLQKITTKNRVLPLECLSYKVPIVRQEQFNKYILKTLDFDMNCGYITSSTHPFTMPLNRYDVRLTTRYKIDDFTYNLYSTIHEAGHGIYGQNEPKEIFEHYLDGGTSSAVHEMHSRFYENHIGKSYEFIDLISKKLRQTFKKDFKNIATEDLYLAINKVEPSLIRTEADELTYSLHILIRYEIEKDLINGKIKVVDLPKIWNSKYKQYLGIDVPSDTLGVLQDIHWSDGSFGYFPSYALGNAYAAQILQVMEKDLDFYQLIKDNKLKQIKKWLTEHTFKYGMSVTPNQWILNVTNEPLNVKYYIDYLTKKYQEFI